MKTVTVVAALMMMAGLTAQGIENSLPNPAASGKDLIIFTYYSQLFPDLESVTYLSDDKVIYATFFTSRNNCALRNLTSQVKCTAQLLFRIAFKKRTLIDMSEKEIIIPVELPDGRSLYLFPEHRLIFDYNGGYHTFARVKPILITESRFSVWLSITL